MRIPPAALEEFAAVYYAIFGEELTKREALNMATRLVTLYEAVLHWRATPHAADPDPPPPATP